MDFKMQTLFILQAGVKGTLGRLVGIFEVGSYFKVKY